MSKRNNTNNTTNNHNNDYNNKDKGIEKNKNNNKDFVINNNIIFNLRNVTYTHRGATLLKEINWAVKKGENWILFGPNGAGKTTLLKLLLGFIYPSEGEAYLLGERLGRMDVWRLREKIGYVSSGLLPYMDPSEPVIHLVVAAIRASTKLWWNPTSDEIKKAINVLNILHCQEFITAPYSRLSQGEQKVVMIARALINSPHVLILDEPAEGLDVGMREELFRRLEDLDKKINNLSIIMVTHRVEEILPLFTNIFFMKDGKVFDQTILPDGFTAERLNALFGKKFIVERHNNRFSAWLSR